MVGGGPPTCMARLLIKYVTEKDYVKEVLTTYFRAPRKGVNSHVVSARNGFEKSFALINVVFP